MDYLLLRTLHVALVGMSLAGYGLRLGATVKQATWVHCRCWRVLPHLIDSALLASGVGLIVAGRWWAGDITWLVAKLLGVTMYIGLAGMALRRARRGQTVVPYALAASAGALWVLAIAFSKSPWGLP
jgi:uncharacterized membrane protein SirB2